MTTIVTGVKGAAAPRVSLEAAERRPSITGPLRGWFHALRAGSLAERPMGIDTTTLLMVGRN